MQFKQLLTDDSAVSPVIGVILMVAITVILAAVIGTFVLGLGDQVSESAPQAQFSFDFGSNYYSDGSTSGEQGLTIVHDGGDAIERGNLQIVVDGTDLLNSTGGIIDSSPPDGLVAADTGNASNWPETVSAGDRITIVEDSDDGSGADLLQDGDAIRVIWASSNSDKTATIGQAEFQP